MVPDAASASRGEKRRKFSGVTSTTRSSAVAECLLELAGRIGAAEAAADDEDIALEHEGMLRCPHGRTVVPKCDIPPGVGWSVVRGECRAPSLFDAAFLATLPFEGHERVLDLCCGSGEFTRTIVDLVPAGEVVGLDAQVSMLDEASACAGPNQSFVLGPVQHLATLVPDLGSFDVVMSRSALHWVPEEDHPLLLAECFRLLRPGGRLRVECGAATTCGR